MNSFQLRCFLSVAETLNFAKSARDMNTTQPTITHQIKSLEDELGVKLFNRSTRVVELTADGVAFIDDAKSIVSIEDRAKLSFSIPNEKSIELMTIGCVNNLQVELLITTLTKLNSSIENFHPRFIIGTRSHLLHLMDTDQIDVMFDLVEEKETFPNYKFLELAKSEVIGFCKDESMYTSIETLSPKEGSNIPIIFTSPAGNMSEFSRFQMLLSEKLDITNIHFAPYPETAVALAYAGIGVSILPSIYVKSRAGMRQIKIEHSPSYKFGMLYKAPAEKQIIKNLITIAKSEFSK